MIKINQQISVQMTKLKEIFDFLQKGDAGTFTSYLDLENKEQGHSCSFKINDKNEDKSLSIIFPNETDLKKQIYYFKDNEKYFLNIIKFVKSSNPLSENRTMVISLECKFKEFQIVGNNLLVTITNYFQPKLNGI